MADSVVGPAGAGRRGRVACADHDQEGRPAHILCVLSQAARRAALRGAVFSLPSTLGVREYPASRVALDRTWQPVALRGGNIRIKIAVRAGRIVHVTPEFEDAAALARSRGIPVRQVLDEAIAATEAAALRPGEP